MNSHNVKTVISNGTATDPAARTVPVRTNVPLNRIYDQKVVETMCSAISRERWASGRKRDKISVWKNMHNVTKTPVNNKLNPNPTAAER